MEALPALDGAVGARLARLAALSPKEYRERFDLRNLFESPDEGVPWRYDEACLRAARMRSMLQQGDRLVCLGNKVAQAFEVLQFPYYEWVSAVRVFDGVRFDIARVPHPSGRNRKLNDKREMERFGRFLRETLSDRA